MTCSSGANSESGQVPARMGGGLASAIISFLVFGLIIAITGKNREGRR